MPAHAYPARRRTVPEGTVLFIASFGGFLAFLDATIVNVAIPDIGRSFDGAGLDSISWVLNAYNIVFAAFLVAAGRLVDLLGRKRLFEIGVVTFTFASLLCGLAPSLGFLIVARMLQAVGAAIIVPSSLALIINAYPVERRGQGVSLYTAISALAAGLGPATGGALIEIADWRWCFLVNLPIGIAAYVLSSRTLVESRAPGRRNVPDVLGALVLAVAIGAVTFGIVKTDTWSVVDPRVLGPFVASVVLIAYFVRRCRWHRAPIVNLALLKIRAFAAANVLTIVAGAGFYSYILCNVLFLTSVWDYNALEAGLALTPGPFVAAAVAGPLGRRMVGRDPRFVLVPGALIWAAGLLWMITQLGPQPRFVSEWLPGMVILGVGAGITFPTLGGTAVAAAPGGAYATSTALNSVSRQFGATLGISLLVAIIGTPTTPQDALTAFDNGWIFALICFVVVAVGVVALGRVVAAPAVIEEEGAIDPGAAALGLSKEPVAPIALGADAPPAARSDDVLSFLAGVEVFQDLDEERLSEIARGARDRLLPGGQTLFEAGDPADALFIVRSGRIQVVGPDGAIFRELGPGDVLGELAVLAGTDRSAAVRARRDSLLLELPWDHVGGLLESDAGFSHAMISVLARQLQASRGLNQPSPPLPRLVAAVALHRGIDVDGFAEQLGAELGEQRRAIVVRDDGRAESDRAASVEAIERDHDIVILCGGDDPDAEWSDFCARQADRVLALAGTRPPTGYQAPPSLIGCDLVCVGDFAEKELTEWFPLLEARTSHRLPGGAAEASAIAAIARRLSGTSIGLVLSGGGARGLAHVGVLDVLEQSGIVIDRVAGTSMGAYIGGLYASGRTADEIDSICYEEWVRRNPLNDYQLPRTSLIRGAKAREMYTRVFEGDIEQMPRAFFCCAVDLVSGDLVEHRYGNAAFGIASSMLLPAFAPPVATGGGRLLVDGGLRNNLPVDIMAADGEGPIIAVDVGGSGVMELNRLEPDELGLNGAAEEVLAWDEDRRVVPPGLGELLVRAVTLGSQDGAALAEQHAALVIRPESDGVGMLEFHMLDEMRASGRRAARAALSR